MKGYGVGLRDLRVFRSYWESLEMVTLLGEYYGEPFVEREA